MGGGGLVTVQGPGEGDEEKLTREECKRGPGMDERFDEGDV